jgi:hypothetical protein
MNREGLSVGWIFVSYVLLIALEVVISLYITPMMSGIGNQPVRLQLQVLNLLGAYAAGSFVVGLVSPKVRLLEPAIAAGLAVTTSLIYTVFTPSRFYGLSTDRLLLGAGIGFAVALGGAWAGEKLAAMLGNRASKELMGG